MSPEQLELHTGKAVFTTCAGCHGNDAGGRDYMYAPNLTGLDADYLKRQLLNFRQGKRGKMEDLHGFQMVGRATAIGDESQIDALIRYIGSLPRKEPVDLTARTVPAGLESQIQFCATCHGDDGMGMAEMEAPALTGLDQAYIAKQLRKFRDGLRGYDESDGPGQSMAASAKTIGSEEEIDQIAKYYGH